MNCSLEYRLIYSIGVVGKTVAFIWNMKLEHVTAAQLDEAGYVLVETTLTIKTVIFIDVRANFVQHAENKKTTANYPKTAC
jgi:hypothetical protein